MLKGFPSTGIDTSIFFSYLLLLFIWPVGRLVAKHIHIWDCKLMQLLDVNVLLEDIDNPENPNNPKQVDEARNEKSYSKCVNVNLFVIIL